MPSKKVYELVNEIRRERCAWEWDNDEAAEFIDKAIAEATNNLLRVLADIRVKTGVGEGPMLSELADAIVAKRDEAVKEATAPLLEALKYHAGKSFDQALSRIELSRSRTRAESAKKEGV